MAAEPAKSAGVENPAEAVVDPESISATAARYGVLDSDPDGPFDRIAAMAARSLRVPFATVSFVDGNQSWIKAAHGWDGLPRLTRVSGPCASTIAGDSPYVINDAANDPRTAGSPLTHGEFRFRFYAAAPIITAGGHALGTVTVLDTEPREPTGADLVALTDLAGMVMDHLELRASALRAVRDERAARGRVEEFASTLQRILLPPSLPAVPGLELACHYHAASATDVTGDFYDVFPVGGGRWAFFLGDVTGHGAFAASVTSQARHTLRAAAHHGHDPRLILEELNNALLMDPHVPHHCTVLFGLLEPGAAGGFDVTLAGGGHPPALLLDSRTGAVDELDLPGGMLVGALPDAEFASRSLHLRAGQALLCYTDGLTEARPGGEFFDERRLKDFLVRRIRTSARAQVDELIVLINDFEPAPADDVALLVLRAPDQDQAVSGFAADRTTIKRPT